jgi:hypothetical protein
VLRLISIAFALTLSTDGLLLPPPVYPPVTTTQVVQRYAISATLDVGAGALDAVETLTVTNQAGLAIDHLNLSVLPRAFGYVTLGDSLTVDGEPARAAWTTGTNLRLDLGRRLRPGETAVIELPFRLVVGSSGGAFTARLSRDRGVLSFGQWFPILSIEHDSYAVGDPQLTFNDDHQPAATRRGGLPRPGRGAQRQRYPLDVPSGERPRLLVRGQPALPADDAHGWRRHDARLYRVGLRHADR